jgi:Zn ribbon nucleic-acid-binding protein
MKNDTLQKICGLLTGHKKNQLVYWNEISNGVYWHQCLRCGYISISNKKPKNFEEQREKAIKSLNID